MGNYAGSMPMNTVLGRDLGRVNFRAEDLPQIKKWENGKSYVLIVRVKMVGKNLVEHYEMVDKNDAAKLEGDFKITSVAALEENEDVKTMSSKEFELHVAKKLSGNR